MRGQCCYLGDVAADPDQFVTFLVDQELALGALETLPTQAPDSIVAVCTKRTLEEQRKEIKF